MLRAEDGYLLLKRGLPPGWEQLENAAFLSFARGAVPPDAHRVSFLFGDALELVGYEYDIHNTVTAGQPPATTTTYWRRLRKLQDGYELAFDFTREDGAVVGQHAGSMSTAVTAWYPSWAWRAGETVCIETPVLAVGRGRGVLVAVVTPSGDPAAPADRVAPIVGQTVGPQKILQDRALLKLFVFP